MSTGRPRQRRWLRRLLWTGVVLVVARVLLALLLPWLVGLGASAAGLELEYRAAHLSLAGLSLRFDDVVVRDPAARDAEPLLTTQELFVDVATWQLLRGELVVVDAALTGTRVHLVREADGQLRLPAAWQSDGAPTAPEPDVPAPPSALRFDAPLQIVSARVHDLRLVLVDADAATRTEFTLDAEVVDVGRSDRRGSLSARVHSPGLLDDLQLQATIALEGERAAASWQATVRGLRPTALPWFDDPTGPPERHVLGLDLDGELQATANASGPLPTIVSTVRLRTQLDEQEQLAVAVQAGPSVTDAGEWSLPFSIAVQGRDLIDELQLEHGRLTIGAAQTRLRGSVRAEGTTLRRLAPWLASRGITMPAAGLDLRAELAADVAGDRLGLAITAVTLGSGDQQLTLARVALEDVQSAEGALRIGALRVDGPRLGVALAPDGALELLGLRLTPPTPAAPAPPPAPAPAPSTPATPFEWPRLALDTVACHGIELRVVDRTFAEPAELTLGLDLDGERLVLGQTAAPGELTATMRMPGAVEQLRVRFAVEPTSESLAVEGELSGTGITAAALAPWLQRAGVTSRLQDGSLGAMVAAQVRADAGGISAGARIVRVRFEDGDEVLLSLRRIDGSGVTLAPTLDLGTWTVDEPYVIVHREADGTVRLLGLQLGQRPTAPAAVAPASAAAGGAPPAATAAASDELRHGALELRRAVLRWVDASRAETADVSLGVDLRIELQASRDEPTAFDGTLRVEPAVGTFGLRGTLQRAAASGRVELAVSGDQLRGPGLQAMLPPGLACTLEDGQLRAGLQAAWRLDPAPGFTLTATGLSLQDRGAELLALDALELDLPEVTATRLHIASAKVRGLRGVGASTADGLHLFGMRFAPAVPSAPPPAPAANEAPVAPVAPVAALPALRLDELDLELERFVWRDRGAADEGEPLVASGRLSLAEPWATAAEPADTPACQLVLLAAATPLLQQLRVEAALAPFALAPTLDLTLRATGLDTTALTRIRPALADTLAGTCEAAEFSATVHGRLDLRRRDPLRFDLSSAFGGELVVEAIDLRASPDGASLLHVDEIALDLRAFDPRTGDVLLRSLEIEGPQLPIENTAAGLELLGLRLPPPTAPPAADAAATEPAAAAPSRPPATGPSAECAVDRLQVLGLGLRYTDRTTEPPTVIPFEDSDLKVQNASTRALTEPRPIAFTAALRGGSVPLDRRVLRSSMLAGLLGSAADALVGGGDRFEPELRPLVEEITISGQVQPFPQPKGQVRARIDGFELPALRGLAKQAGVDIADGVLHFDLEARLRGAEGVDVRARPTFTWLSLSEPPGGPISTYLKLPAPLDTVLFALRNDDDEHVLPLQVQVPAAGLSAGAVASAAAEAVARLIADAVASAAFRVGGAVTGAIGLGGATDLSQLVATLDFAAGDPLAAGGSIDDVLAAVADDPELVIVLAHELGRGDLDRARQLASPPPAIVAASVARLRASRAGLEQERELLAGRTAALYGASRMQDAWQLQHRLREVDDRLGALQRTQEEALRMQSGEDERSIRRRTRSAAVAMAEARLETVRHQIGRQLGATAAGRVQWRTPRGVETAGLPDGGRVVVTVRRRKAP